MDHVDSIIFKHLAQEKISARKDIQQNTKLNIDAYHFYHRCSGITAVVKGKILDNRFVVPYNRFLLLKYDAHINVEVSTSLRAVKYFYIYTMDQTVLAWF